MEQNSTLDISVGDSTAEFEKYEALIENDLDETTDESEIKTEEVDFKVENDEENELLDGKKCILKEKTTKNDNFICFDSKDKQELKGESNRELASNASSDIITDESPQTKKEITLKNNDLKVIKCENNPANQLESISESLHQESSKMSKLKTKDEVDSSDDTTQSTKDIQEDSTKTCCNNSSSKQNENKINELEESNNSTSIEESITNETKNKQKCENMIKHSNSINEEAASKLILNKISSKNNCFEQNLPVLPNEVIEKKEKADEKLQQINNKFENGLTLKSETSSMCEIHLIQQPTTEQSDVYIPCVKTKPVLGEMVHNGLESPNFNMWNLSRDSMVDHLEFMYQDLGISESWKISRPILKMFLLCIREKYHNNPYHNFYHCFCVTQMAYSIVKTLNLESKLEADYIGCLITAAICHDVDHPGVNNTYMKNAQTSLAILYNNDSVLEQHHFATACRIMSNKSCNILMNVENKVEILNIIGELILATDLEKHKQLVAENKIIFQQKFEMEKRSHVLLMLKIILKCADVSNEVRPEKIATPWVERIFTEHAMQFNRENTEGIKESSFMDPKKLNVPKEQISFIKGLLIPMYNELARYSPVVNETYLKPLQEALTRYEELVETSD